MTRALRLATWPGRIGFPLTLLAACLWHLVPGCGGGGGAGGGSLGQSGNQVSYILLSQSFANDLILETPLARLVGTLKTAGLGEPEVLNEIPTGLPDECLVIGESEDPVIKEVFKRNGMSMPPLGEDALYIRSFVENGNRAMMVTGKGPRGVVYAIYELRRRIALEAPAVWTALEINRSPAFRDRFTSAFHPPTEPPIETDLMDPDEVLRMGYNGIILHGLTSLCTYDDYDPDLYPPSLWELRQIVEEDRAYVGALLEEAKEHHLEVFLTGDELMVPLTALVLYNPELCHDNEPWVLCPAKAKLHEILEATIDEIFKWFPQLDGIQIRFGEVYNIEFTTHGNPPTQGSCPSCEHMDDEDKLSHVTQQIRSFVVDHHGRRYNQRTWGYADSWHSMPDKYHAVVDPIPPDGRLTFSFKQQRTDYWRYNILNPNFEAGLHGQWVEFQCQREYEGKGAFPLYMGRYFAEGGPEATPHGGLKDLLPLGVKGGFGWCRGGGWEGPYIQREEWIELNDYALGRLLWDPLEDPYQMARDWLRLKLKPSPSLEAIDAFEQILRLSEEALLKARYVAPFAQGGYVGQGIGWTPCHNWLRDDKLTGRALDIAEKLYDTGELKEAMIEKDEVLDLADALLAQWDLLLKNTAPGDPFWGELYHTALYGDSLLRLSAHYFKAAFHYAAWKNSGAPEDRAAALEELALWEAEWTRHTQDIPLLSGTASVFQDDGMVDLCDAMLKDMNP